MSVTEFLIHRYACALLGTISFIYGIPFIIWGTYDSLFDWFGLFVATLGSVVGIMGIKDLRTYYKNRQLRRKLGLPT